MKASYLFTFALIALLSSTKASAEVWEAKAPWSRKMERLYSRWVESAKVNQTMFIDRKSPYFGVRTDCADFAFTLRAIFAYEHQLPFVLPVNSSEHSSLTNSMTYFDHLPAGQVRLIAFLNLVGASAGAYQLGHLATYPIAIKSIRPGDLFTFYLKTSDDLIQHAMVIKAIHPDGGMDLLYATQRVRKNNSDFFDKILRKNVLPLYLKRNQLPKFRPVDPTKGFRRFLWPEHLNQDPSQLPKEFSFSLEQFEWAAQLDDKAFFQQVRNTMNRNRGDEPNPLSSILRDLCEQAQDRVEVVHEAVDFMREHDATYCMNHDEYFLFSTPMRDFVLAETFNQLERVWDALPQSLAARFDDLHWRLSFGILSTTEATSEGGEELSKFCPVPITEDNTLTLKDLFRRVRSKNLSSDPHDGLEARWGDGNKTTAEPHRCVTKSKS